MWNGQVTQLNRDGGVLKINYFLYIIFRPTEYRLKRGVVNFLTHPRERRLTCRLTVVLIYGWVGWKHTWLNLIGVYPLVELMIETFIALKQLQTQWAKQYVLCDFLQRFQRVVYINVVSHRSMDTILQEDWFCHPKKVSGATYCLFFLHSCVIFYIFDIKTNELNIYK